MFSKIPQLNWNKYFAGADAPESIKYEIFPDNFALDAKYCPSVSNDTQSSELYLNNLNVFFRKQVQTCQGNSA